MPRKRAIKGRFCRKVKAPKSHFAKKSFRWTKRGRNWLLIGCPKGQWNAKRRRCKVGTRLHEILVAAKAGKACCPRRDGTCVKKG